MNEKINMSSKTRIKWLDGVRALAVLSVVLCHCTEAIYKINAADMLKLSPLSETAAVVYFTAGRLGVPFFLMISGYLLLDRKYTSEDCIRFWKTRCLHLLVCTEIWIVIYRFFFSVLAGTVPDWKVLIGEMLFIRTASVSHMWYMPMILGMYILIPFAANALQTLDKRLTAAAAAVYSVFAFGYPMLVSLLDYMAQNPEPVINALEEYLKVTMQASGATEAEIADLTSSMQAARDDVEAFRTVLADVKDAVETGMQNETVAALLAGFHYTGEVTKVNDRYYGSENYQMAYKGGTMCAVTSSTRTQEARGSVVFPSISVRPDAITTELETLTDKYNPVTGVSATWYYDEPTAFLTEERAEPVYWGSSASPIVEYVVQDGRIYLPLRSICDMLGETVTWDQATKTASVVQGETVIPMDSILVDSTSYIGVRGFEALGYQVTYTNTDGQHVATIVK